MKRVCVLLALLLLAALGLMGCSRRAEPAGMCRLVIRCDTIVARLDELEAAKREYVPEDGLLLDSGDVPFSQGDSAFDLLRREITSRHMQFEFKKTPVSGGVYVQGIGNLYEFDMGPLSGWQFAVNKVYGSEDCASYILSDGDLVEFMYTCDLGRDLDGGSIYW